VYDWLRTLNGISEGGSELGHETTIPLEANMDYFSGIDFHKGCYLGQELVARTYHQGQVRKRMLPFISTPYTTDELQRNPELRSTLEQLSLKASPGLILPEYILSPELGWDTTSAADGAAINDAAPLQSIYNANGPNPTPTPSQTQPGVVVPRARASTGPGSVIRTHPAFQTGIAMMRLDHVLPPAIANATTTATTENDATPSTQQQQQQQQPQQQQPRPATLFAVGTKVVKLVLPLWWDQYYTSQLEALGDGVASPDSVHTRPASVEP
jgi:folate-binding protein YgfZ